MMTGVRPHIPAEGVATTITTDVEGETTPVVEDFVEEAEGEDPLVSTMMTIIIEVGEMVEEIVTETTTSLSEEEEGEEGEVVVIITMMTMITTDLRDRAQEVDSEWDVGEEEEAHMAVGVAVDGRTKEEEVGMITVETMVALGGEEEGGEE